MFSENGMCKYKDVREEDVKIKNLKKQLKENGIMREEETINGSMEIISFDDTLGEMEEVARSKLQVNKVILINSIALYTAIDEYKQGVVADEVEVNTKYKTVDKKVNPVAAPLPEDSWQRITEVARDPCLRDPKGVGHVFTDETRRRHKVGGGEFLLPKEESKF